ncbi:MAG: calcium/sodium antiporter [Planctomycetes bacterium]|nr:calcium/sodium antiporter [Planctomycetota bacterium]
MPLTDLGILLASLLLLTLGAELLVRGSVALAERLGMSSFVIGLTIVGFGTSTPELVTSLRAALGGQDDIAVGNVVGSNIFNIALILGVSALICPIPVHLKSVQREVWVVILAGAAPWLAFTTGGEVGRVVGGVFVAFFVWQMWSSIVRGRSEGQDLLPELDTVGAPVKTAGIGAWLPILLVAVGLALLVLGANLLIDSASAIARSLGVSELAIALTIVAGGTSAPELVTSVVAAVRKQPEIAVGNILGSNIFNIFLILGLTGAITPQAVSPQVMALDTPVMFAVSLALLPVMGRGAHISRTEGAVLVIGYVAYIWVLFAFAPGWFPTVR